MYRSESDILELMILAAHYFIKIQTKGTNFHAISFYKAASSALYELRKVYSQYAVNAQPSLLQFMAVRGYGQPDSS